MLSCMETKVPAPSVFALWRFHMGIMVGCSGQDPGPMPNYCSRSCKDKYRKNLGYHSYEMGIQVLSLALLVSM